MWVNSSKIDLTVELQELGGVSLGPQLGYPVVLLPVLGVLGGDGADQGVRGIAVRQQGADGEEHLVGRQEGGEARRALGLPWKW